MYSFGTIETFLNVNDYQIANTFHLVDNTFAIPTDGILGRDFLTKHKCEIYYDAWELKIYFNANYFHIPIKDNLRGSIIIPARSEVIRHMSSLNITEDMVVESMECFAVTRLSQGSHRVLD